MCAEIAGEITGVCATGVSDQQGADRWAGGGVLLPLGNSFSRPVRFVLFVVLKVFLQHLSFNNWNQDQDTGGK